MEKRRKKTVKSAHVAYSGHKLSRKSVGQKRYFISIQEEPYNTKQGNLRNSHIHVRLGPMSKSSLLISFSQLVEIFGPVQLSFAWAEPPLPGTAELACPCVCDVKTTVQVQPSSNLFSSPFRPCPKGNNQLFQALGIIQKQSYSLSTGKTSILLLSKTMTVKKKITQEAISCERSISMQECP